MNTVLPLTLDPTSSNTETTEPEWAQMAADLIHARQTVLPKRLMAPGPDADQLQVLLGAAAAAPDHGQLLPWLSTRYIEYKSYKNLAMGETRSAN